MTRSEFVTQALVYLGVARENISADDYEVMDKYVDGGLAQLSADNVITVSDDDNIDDSVFHLLAMWMANLAGPEFGSSFDLATQQKLESRVKSIATGGPSYETIPSVYF